MKYLSNGVMMTVHMTPKPKYDMWDLLKHKHFQEYLLHVSNIMIFKLLVLTVTFTCTAL